MRMDVDEPRHGHRSPRLPARHRRMRDRVGAKAARRPRSISTELDAIDELTRSRPPCRSWPTPVRQARDWPTRELRPPEAPRLARTARWWVRAPAGTRVRDQSKTSCAAWRVERLSLL